ncbi:MAG: hypothetical protein R3C10_20750 [Pirellulales bacterium]
MIDDAYVKRIEIKRIVALTKWLSNQLASGKMESREATNVYLTQLDRVDQVAVSLDRIAELSPSLLDSIRKRVERRKSEGNDVERLWPLPTGVSEALQRWFAAHPS